MVVSLLPLALLLQDDLAAVPVTAAPQNSSAAASPASTRTARQKALTIVSGVVLVGLAWGGYEWYSGRHEESTDNAYVQGNVIQITPQTSGTVTSILAEDTAVQAEDWG